RRKRETNGRGSAGRLSPESFSDDEDRRPQKENRGAADRRIAPAAADGPRGPAADSRSDPDGGSRSSLCAGRRDGGGDGSQAGGETAVHRVHRAQGSGHPPA